MLTTMAAAAKRMYGRGTGLAARNEAPPHPHDRAAVTQREHGDRLYGRGASLAGHTEASPSQHGLHDPRTRSQAAQNAAQKGIPVTFERVAIPELAHTTFTLPNGVPVNATKMQAFSQALIGAVQSIEKERSSLRKAVHDLGQKLLAMHAGEVQDALGKYYQAQVTAWTDKRAKWVSGFRNDPEIGRNRQETTLKRVHAVIDKYGEHAGTKRAQALKDHFTDTGAGDHVETIRFMNWVADLAKKAERA